MHSEALGSSPAYRGHAGQARGGPREGCHGPAGAPEADHRGHAAQQRAHHHGAAARE